MSEQPKRRLTVKDARRAQKQTDAELKAEYGDKWQEVRALANEFQARAVKTSYTAIAWATEWFSRLPKMPAEPAVFSLEDIISMIQAYHKEPPGTGQGWGPAAAVHLLEWGKMIAEAILDGRASEIQRLAEYVEKVQDCRPKGKPGSKAPWPHRAASLRSAPKAVVKRRRRLNIAKALRQMLAEEAEITRAALARRAGVPTKGKSYTEAFDTPELKGIPMAKSGKKPAIPTPKRSQKG